MLKNLSKRMPRPRKAATTDALEFVTPTYIKILRLFLSHPMEEYHEREVARRSRVSSGSANRMLRLMADSGILEVQRKGRMAFYRFNLASPTARQFKILANVNSLEGILAKLRTVSKRVVLFGSCAEGTDVAESDIDMMIVTDNEEGARREIEGFNSGAERRIAPIVTDANGLAKLRLDDAPLYDNIERGIVLWEINR